MALTPGTRIGPYEVVSTLGAGGMGEVYRARDSKLNREVALKVLSESFTHDGSRAARLRREAQVLASLNHPNIGGIYGLEDADGVTALVLELIEGPTLADRIAEGPLPLDEAVSIAKQITDALAAAHDQGVVHRDLKPANIKLRPDGTVKVLDFGLAKAVNPDSSAPDVHASTITSDHSRAGVILGTPAYMSPEQAAGSVVDKRTDIWAFGLVLFEMLTGNRIFNGESVTHVLAAVLREEPDWNRMPADTPETIRRLLRRCLTKDRKRRLDSAAVARMELEDEPLAADVPRSAPKRSLPLSAIAIAAAVAGAVVTAVIMWNLSRPVTVTTPTARFTIATPAALFLRPSLQAVARDFAVAPDGSFLVYRAGATGQLAMRRFDRLEISTFDGIAGVSMPFVSPDSQWIGFVDDMLTLKKVAISGGAPVALARLPVWPRGASWVDDATIVVGTNSADSGLLKVPAGGGEPVTLTTPDRAHGEEGHLLPSALPGGHAALFTIGNADPAKAQIAVVDLQTGKYTVVLTGGRDAQYVASGHLIYLAGLGLSAVRFDADRRAVSGDPVRVLDGVAAAPTSALNVAVTQTGTMVFIPVLQGGSAPRALLWVDRQGRETPIAAPLRAYESARLSPDGGRIAVSIRDQENDIWTWDLARATLSRLTFDPDVDLAPVWTPDSRRIVFTSARTGAFNLYAKDVDGTAPEIRLASVANTQVPDSITPDNTAVITHEVRPQTKSDLVRYPLTPSAAAASSTDLVHTPFEEWNGEVSPDGRLLAYQSDESGQGEEVYVRPYPQVGNARWQVSSGGGTAPVWTRNGRELIYLDAAHRLTSVIVDSPGGSFHTGSPATIANNAYASPGPWRTYDVSPDGQRFLVMKQAGSAADATLPGFVVVQNSLEELKRLFPSK